eukprot:509968_1
MSPEWERIYESSAEGITALAIQSISIVILASLLIHFILFTVLPNKNAKRKHHQTRSVINMLCIMCFIFSILLCCSNLIFHSIITFAQNIHCKYRSWTIVFLLMQRICLYWFYIQRLKITFEHSLLRIRTTYIRILYISSCITISISAMLAWYYYTVKECADSAQILSILPAFLFDIFWCVFLSIYFVLKLRQSIIEFHNHSERGINQNIVLLMCKLTNIIIWSALILQLSQWILGFFTGWIISCVTLNVVSTCVTLLFTFGPYSKLYEKYVCCLCHQCIIKWCKIKVVEHIVKSSHDFRVKKQERMQQMYANDTNTDDEQESLKADSPLVAYVD